MIKDLITYNPNVDLPISKVILTKVQNVFNKHIGRKNAITKFELFKTIYGNPENMTDIQIYIYWMSIRKCMHHLRVKTNYFIIAEKTTATYIFYVVTNHKEADIYEDMLEKNIKRIKYMIAKCRRAVDEKLYLQLDETNNGQKRLK